MHTFNDNGGDAEVNVGKEEDDDGWWSVEVVVGLERER